MDAIGFSEARRGRISDTVPVDESLESTEEHRELRSVEEDAIRPRTNARHSEATLREPLVIEDEAATVPEKHLDAVHASPHEDEEVTRVRIERQRLAH